MNNNLQQVLQLLLAMNQDQSNATANTAADTGSPEFAIVIATNGFIFIGDVNAGADCVKVSPRAGHRTGALRYWGTQKGLGELVANGPTSKTVIDEISSPVVIQRQHCIAWIPCHAAKFTK